MLTVVVESMPSRVGFSCHLRGRTNANRVGKDIPLLVVVVLLLLRLLLLLGGK